MRKTFRTAYLYSDGHAVVIYEKTDRNTGVLISWAEITEKIKPHVPFEGRMIFSSKAEWDLVRKASHLTHCPKNQSQNMQEASIEHESLFVYGQGNSFEGIMLSISLRLHGRVVASYRITYQDETRETLDDLRGQREWGMVHISNPLPESVSEAT